MRHVPRMPAEFRALEHAIGAYAAADVFAADDHPRFDMSAVDGYAVADPEGPWRLVGHVAAGQRLAGVLSAGECARIFTGAAIPQGAMGVLMQERSRVEGDAVMLAGNALQPGANIRFRGEAFRTGELLLPKGTRLNPAHIGLLASAGLDEVMVTIEPQVGVLRTGGEFLDAQQDAEQRDARIHSSNDRMLIAALRQAWLNTDDVAYVAEDSREAIRGAIEQAVADSDVLVATGGVSVGEHDLLRPVLEEMGAVIHFHGVKQKPGKPMLFATLGRTPVFGLPGNPRAVLVCWHMYVLPFLRAMQGAAEPGLFSERLPSARTVELKGGRAEFRAAQVRDGMVHLLPDEGSHMLTTMAMADALAYFPADAGEVGLWKDVEVHYLPRP